MFPVVVELTEQPLPLGGELVVLARRTGVRFAPFVVEQAVAAHLAQQRVERAFLRREVGAAQALEDVGDVDLADRDDAQDQEFEQAFPDGGKLFRGWHRLASYLS